MARPKVCERCGCSLYAASHLKPKQTLHLQSKRGLDTKIHHREQSCEYVLMSKRKGDYIYYRVFPTFKQAAQFAEKHELGTVKKTRERSLFCPFCKHENKYTTKSTGKRKKQRNELTAFANMSEDAKKEFLEQLQAEMSS